MNLYIRHAIFGEPTEALRSPYTRQMEALEHEFVLATDLDFLDRRNDILLGFVALRKNDYRVIDLTKRGLPSNRYAWEQAMSLADFGFPDVQQVCRIEDAAVPFRDRLQVITDISTIAASVGISSIVDLVDNTSRSPSDYLTAVQTH